MDQTELFKKRVRAACMQRLTHFRAIFHKYGEAFKDKLKIVEDEIQSRENADGT